MSVAAAGLILVWAEASSQSPRQVEAAEPNTRAAAGYQQGAQWVELKGKVLTLRVLRVDQSMGLLRQARATAFRQSRFTHKVSAPEYVGLLCPR